MGRSPNNKCGLVSVLSHIGGLGGLGGLSARNYDDIHNHKRLIFISGGIRRIYEGGRKGMIRRHPPPPPLALSRPFPPPRVV